MIFFVAPRDGVFAMQDVLGRGDAGDLVDLVGVLSYEDLFARCEAPIGSYIFAGLDQLTPMATELVGRFREALADAAPGVALLNDPALVRHRYELLHAAHEAGRNGFRVRRATSLRGTTRFPVFLRCEREHTGSLTGLIRSPSQLRREIVAACVRGFRLRDLLVVEYCDTSAKDGLFRKYSAFVVGDQIIPRFVEQSREWVTKDQQRIITEAAAREELDYVQTNPHEEWLRETFRLARTEYGRADYGLLNGRPQLWEVNLNPTMSRRLAPTAPSHRTDEERALLAPARQVYKALFHAALHRLDRNGPGGAVRVEISLAETDRLAREQREFQRIRARRTVVARALQPLARLMKRALQT